MSRRARARARIAAMTSELAGQALPADEIDLRGLDDEGGAPGPDVLNHGRTGMTGDFNIRPAHGGYPALAAPVAQQAEQSPIVTARPLEWDQDSSAQWTDRRCGFSIMEERGDDLPFSAAWGEGDAAQFATLQEAQAWCQAGIDRWIAHHAVVYVVTPPQPVAQPHEPDTAPWPEVVGYAGGADPGGVGAWLDVRLGDGPEATRYVRQAAQPVAPAGWQPIETAPRGSGENGPGNVNDAAYVEPPRLLLNTSDGVLVGYYDWYYHPGYGRGASEYETTWRTADGACIYGPTHWMPLPAAPTQEVDRIETGPLTDVHGMVAGAQEVPRHE